MLLLRTRMFSIATSTFETNLCTVRKSKYSSYLIGHIKPPCMEDPLFCCGCRHIARSQGVSTGLKAVSSPVFPLQRVRGSMRRCPLVQSWRQYKAASCISQPFGVDAARATSGQRRHIQYYKPRFTRDRNRPLRSVLFMPGSRTSALEKASKVPADVIAFDLEDAVAYDRKVEARQMVKNVIEKSDFGRRYVTVRVNVLGSAWWTEDIATMATLPRVDAVIIPKVNSADTLITVNELLARYGAHEKMAIWAMIETPAAVMSIKEIAASSHVVPRLEALVMGTSDLTNELHAVHTPDRIPLIYSLSKCVVAARAFKLRVIDGVFLSLNDPEGLEQVCKQGRALGFDGKSLIHPKTVEAANQFFGPMPDEVEHSQRVLQAWEKAQAQGLGVAVVDGKLIEALHVDEAKRTLEIRKNLEALETSYRQQ